MRRTEAGVSDRPMLRCLRDSKGRQTVSFRQGRRPKLVWIDDYEPALEVYKAVYEELGYQVTTARCGSEGLACISAGTVDLVIVDYDMPEMDGGAVAKCIKSHWPELPVVIFSGSDGIPDDVKNVVDACCDKDGRRDALPTIIRFLLNSGISPTAPLPLLHAPGVLNGTNAPV